jgi:small nuclear ribonucleoprotein (snRNP)-like protein
LKERLEEKGPLDLLWRWFRSESLCVRVVTEKNATERARVRVVVHGARSVRGVCVGTLCGVDKQMNLLLRDVHEEYFSVALKSMQTRRLGQVFLKGDNVIVISLSEQAQRQ